MRGEGKATSGDSSKGHTPPTPDEVFKDGDTLLKDMRKDETPEDTSTTETPPKEKSKEVGKKVNRIIINEISDDDKNNILAEAIEMKTNRVISEETEKAKKEYGRLGGLLAGLKYNLPIVGAILKAKKMNSYKETAVAGINENGLEGAFKALKLDHNDSKLLKFGDVTERAEQIIDSGVQEGNVFKSRLDEKETVERIELDDEANKTIEEALNEYYRGLKEGKKSEEGFNKAELDNIFNDKLKGLSEKANFDLIQKAAEQKRNKVEELFNDEKVTHQKIYGYTRRNISLYKANVNESIHTRKEVDEIAKAVVVGSGVLAGGAMTTALVSTILKREAIRGVRSAARALGATGGVTGAIAGGISGIMRGAEKAGALRSEHEIEKINDPSAVVEAIREKYGDGKVKAKIGSKQWRQGEDILDKLELNRNRVNASDLIEKLSNEELSEDDLMELYAQTLARGKFSSENQVDLIKYQGDDRAKLEKALYEAYVRLNINDDPEKRKEYEDFLKANLDKFQRDYKEAKELEKDFRNRMILVNAVQGALVGYAAGTIFKLATMGVGTALGLETDDTGPNPDKTGELIKGFKGKPIIIEDDPQGGVSVGFDKDADGILDNGEFLYGEGESAGIDLTNDAQYQKLADTLKNDYNIDLQREAIGTSRYGEISIGNYLENAKNTVDNSGGVDWSRSATRVAFGTPTATVGDGMDTYEVPVWGMNGEPVPDGAKFYLDLDGDGPGQTLEYTIENGKAIVPADVLDTSHVGNGGAASFIGVARVGEMDGNTMISYATAFGENADLTTNISAAEDGTGFAFTAIDAESGEGISQFAVNAGGEKISNLSEIFNGIPVDGSERLPSTFIVNDIGDGAEGTTLGSGVKIADLDYKGGYHEELDSSANYAFMESKSYLGTPIKWDLDGDGIMSSSEEASYFTQLQVRTGTNPFVLTEMASSYGLLEPNRLEEIIPRNQLIEWGISDGTIDNMTDVNILIEHIKMPENADYWDKLANSTINEMQTQMKGGSFKVETITDRASTYANSNRDIDAWRGSTPRTIIIAKNADGQTVGNTGIICEQLGISGQDNVGFMPDCDQVGGNRFQGNPTATTTTPTSTTPATGDNPTPEPGPTPEPTPTPPDNPPQPKNQIEANENSGANQGIVTPEGQERQITPEPSADEAHPYNQGTNTYDYTPKEQAEKIGYEVNKTDNATVGTGEVNGNTPSADGSGDTIEKNLNEATGVEGANNQGF